MLQYLMQKWVGPEFVPDITHFSKTLVLYKCIKHA